MSDNTSVADRELPIILGKPHMAYLQAIGRGPTDTKTDTRAQCSGCSWEGTHYRTPGPATRELLEHENDTAQAAYGSLKRSHALLLEALEMMLAEFGARLSDGKPLGFTIGSMNRALALIRQAEAALAAARPPAETPEGE